MALTCELCGGSNFVKTDGMFVCQDCGCKYSVEEARKLMNQSGANTAQHNRKRAEEATQTQRISSQLASGARIVAQQMTDTLAQSLDSASQAWAQPSYVMHSSSEFNQAYGMNLQGAQAINNYACQGWRMALGDYKKLEHPSKSRQDKLGEQATQALLLLDNAARLEPQNHLQNIVILSNCQEIASQAHSTSYYEKDDEGKWRSHSFRLNVKLPGQSESWNDMIRFHSAFIEQIYREGHLDEVEERAALVARKDELDAQLDALKDEKRSKGFFNFSEKREVKERMKPYKEELSQVLGQIGDLDEKVDDYVEKRLKELETGFIRL